MSQYRNTVVILGSTGSIGTQGLDVISRHPERFTVTGLVAGGAHVRLLAQQVVRHHVPQVAVYDEAAVPALHEALEEVGARYTQIQAGPQAVNAIAGSGADLVLNGITGSVGLEPSIAALRAGSQLALANKESVVAGGHLLFGAQVRDDQINPVDSEHSAIWQSLRSGTHAEVSRLVVTASGGPFRGWKRADMSDITPEQALNHPTWHMGPVVTINSSTLMNKGLEFIEAMWLFSMPPEKIDIVVHPQSIIHSMVEYVDGSVMAQMGAPDMMIPIQYALTWPHRYESPARTLDLLSCGPLTFSQPDTGTFTCLASCIEAAKRGGLYPCVVNGANEEAVSLFLQDKIGYLDLFDAVEAALDHFDLGDYTSVEEVLEADRMARAFVRERYGK